MSLDTFLDDALLDPSKCSKASLEEKRGFVYQLSKYPNDAIEKLQSWSRQDILQVLCAEMGKERKYTGLTKLKMIEHLLKLISEKRSADSVDVLDTEHQSLSSPRLSKRQRKADQPSRVPVPVSNVSVNSTGSDMGNAIYCKNSACKATLSKEDKFCKRCSCCICYKYDDNKDPSVWLICTSEPPFQDNSCGMSCHLECALKHERSGIGKDGKPMGVDGCFSCVSCGKLNDLLGCWRKQLLMARETRRVDILCYRIALSKKLLSGTEKYQCCYEIVDEAVKKLEAEVGPLTGLPVRISRGIVNRLSAGPEVQKLCASAVELLDSFIAKVVSDSSLNPVRQVHADPVFPASNMLRFEDIGVTSLTVIVSSGDYPQGSSISYTLWHCKAFDEDYPVEPTCILAAQSPRFVIAGLVPATEYSFKVVASNGTEELGMCEVRSSTSCIDEVVNAMVVERSQSPATNCSSLSNPSSVEDESNNIICNQNDNQEGVYLSYGQDNEKFTSANLPNCVLKRPGLSDDGPRDAVPLLLEERATRVPSSMPDSDILNEGKKHSNDRSTEAMSTDNGSVEVRTGLECVPFAGSTDVGLPITPCKLETSKDGTGRVVRSKSSNRDLERGIGKGEEPQDGSTSKKRSGERRDEECTANGLSNRDFEYYVKVIRWLECEGHIEKNFRQKFLTWYSLRATSQEVRIVKVFIDTLIEDPKSLAEQLVDSFTDSITSKVSSLVPAGFCMKLWH